MRSLTTRVRGLVFIGERRWDVILDRNQIIKLPEIEPMKALKLDATYRPVEVIDAIEDNLSTDTLTSQFTLEQSSAVNENIRLENYNLHEEGVLLEETDGDKVLFENDSTSVGENIALEVGSDDSGITAYLLQETYIVGDSNTTKTAPIEQNELFDSEDDSILDFTEKNPFGDVGD